MELLVVIVVIAVLAAITVTTYSGIQGRANNVKTISAVKQAITLILSYQATYGSYPLEAGAVIARCTTVDNRCTSSGGAPNGSDNSALITEMAKIGTPPQSAGSAVSSGEYGVQYIYLPPANTPTFNGNPAPIRLEYWLAGSAVSCGVQNIAASVSNSGNVVSSTTGYSSTTGNVTRCDVRL